MDLSIEFWIQIVIQVIMLAFFAGIIWTKLGYIEKKQDKHNALIERMYVVEQSTKSAHHRIDEMHEEINGKG